MTSSQPAKFAFDTVFDKAGDIAHAPVRTKRMFTADEVEQIRAQALAEGRGSVTARAEAEAAQALSQIAEAAQRALGSLAKVAHDHRVHSADLALAAARKIAHAALETFPEAPVSAALAELAREIEATPKLVVRCAPDLVERVQAALDRTGQACGLSAQIAVSGDPALPLAAFVLDWGDGRATFDPEESAERVGAALRTALAAEGLHGESLTLPSEAGHG